MKGGKRCGVSGRALTAVHGSRDKAEAREAWP